MVVLGDWITHFSYVVYDGQHLFLQMKEFVISEAKTETAVLVGLITQTQDEAKPTNTWTNWSFWPTPPGLVTVRRFTQRVGGPSSVTYVGSGKLQEIKPIH